MTRMLVCVLSCQKNKGLWSNILDRMHDNILIFCGGSDTTQFDPSAKIMYLNCNDFYEGLPEKMICLIDQVLTLDCFKDVTHILKIDDHDTFFTSDTIEKISSMPELWKYDYIGQKLQEVPGSGYGGYHHGKVSKGCYWDSRFYTGGFCTWVDGGHSYILSRTALELINSTSDPKTLETIRKTEIYEDVMIAKLLAKHGIKPFQLLYDIKAAVKIA